MTASWQLDRRESLERTWTRNGGARAPERRSQLDRIVMAMLRDATADEARQDGKTSK